jgi:N-acetylmuramoyl-L-alanine amidase
MKPVHQAVTCCLLLTVWWVTSSFHRAPVDNTIDYIVLDPGHGGQDPGAIGLKVNEKTVVLQVALLTQKLFKQYQPNTRVELTRSKDEFVGLMERAEFANKRRADLFISIHCNANPSKAAYGSETFAMGLHKEDANMSVMMTENSSILLEANYKEKYDNFNPRSQESYIMFSLMQHAFLRQSLKLATKMENQYKGYAKRYSRGIKQAGFLVLWKTSMPAVLTELGFVSNAVEEKFLMSEEGQRYIAQSIYRAVKDYQDEASQEATPRPTTTKPDSAPHPVAPKPTSQAGR